MPRLLTQHSTQTTIGPPSLCGRRVCMYVCIDSVASAHARTRAHRPAVPRQSSGATSHGLSAGRHSTQTTTIGSPSLCGRRVCVPRTVYSGEPGLAESESDGGERARGRGGESGQSCQLATSMGMRRHLACRGVGVEDVECDMWGVLNLPGVGEVHKWRRYDARWRGVLPSSCVDGWWTRVYPWALYTRGIGARGQADCVLRCE